MDRDGFQPCVLETGTGSPAPRWERTLVGTTLIVHVLDQGLDLLVVALFYSRSQWTFLLGSAAVILWSWIIASVYVGMGAGGATPGDIDDGPVDRSSRGGVLQRCVMNLAQVRIFVEAHCCLFRGGDTDYFHTLRLMESVLQSAPNAAVQLYALALWAVESPLSEGLGPEDDGGTNLLRASVFMSLVSVGLGLAMWEQKVQIQASPSYIFSVATLRVFEVASRCSTLAVFSAIMHPQGFGWSLAIDYLVMIFFIRRHRSVQLAYGLVVALPLVLVSLEPLVWRREDHAVPKDVYYKLRIAQSLIMWFVIVQEPLQAADGVASSVWRGCQQAALLSTLGLYATLPCVWLAARKLEMARDASEWADDGAQEGLQDDEAFSQSDYSSGSDLDYDDRDGGVMPNE